MEVQVYSSASRVNIAIESLKAGMCEKRNVSGIGVFLVCPQTKLRMYTEGGNILLTEKIGVAPVARLSTNAPYAFEITHPGMAEYIERIPKSVMSAANS